MKLKRQSTEKRVSAILSKDEPTFGFLPLSGAEMTQSLNWYNQYKDRDDSHKYLAEYCKAQGIKTSPQQIELQVSTAGFVCRMLSRGALLDAKSMQWLASHLKAMSGAVVEVKEPATAPVVKPTVTIQDRLKQKASESIGLLEGAVDDFILSDFKKMPNTLQLMRENEVKGAHGPGIVNFFKKYRDEIRLALAETDEQLAEGYSNYTHAQLKKMDTLYDQIVSDTLTIMGESVAAKSPRKKKAKSPEKQVKSLKFCPEDPTLKIKSVPPTRVIGAEGLWSYNRVTRMLSYYAADDASGLAIKGCTILNMSKSKSHTKKLRKPEEILPQVLSGGKVVLKNLFDNLTTKDAKVTGRINKDTLLVRVIA